MARMRHYILGTDEAGYGPNLGPLVVACVVWEMGQNDTVGDPPPNDFLADFERRLGPSIAETSSQLGKDGKILLIGDSKKLYQSGKLHTLANSVRTAVELCGHELKHWSELIALLAPEAATEINSPDSLQFFDALIESPMDVESHRQATENVRNALKVADISLCDIEARMIFPRNFNQQLQKLGNKSTLLTETTLSLVANAIRLLPENAGVTVLCDKHGGRNRYADVLYQFFPDDGWVEILCEGTPLSVYRLRFTGRTLEFRFQAKADRHIPAALASMTAKLLREMAMADFNRFWQNHIPGLQPTAGYPVDARRFFGQIEETRKKFGISKSDIWREK